MPVPEVSFAKFAAWYATEDEKGSVTGVKEREFAAKAVAALHSTLLHQKDRFQPTGWVLLRCEDMCSSRLGQTVVLPYGPHNTLKEVPTTPISPRGLASDTSVAVAVLLADALPEECPEVF